jgi:hypothetical protein
MQVVLESQRPEFLINSMKDAASKGTRGIAVMQLLLQQQGANTLITEEMMKAAAESMSVELMQLLLQQQGANVLITEEVLKAATTDLNDFDCREVLLLLLDQPGASELITEEVWGAVSELPYMERLPLLKSILGKITITEEMTAIFVRLFSRESVERFLVQRGADVSITAEVMKAALENAIWSEDLTLFLLNWYDREAYEALMLLGEEGRVPFGKEEHSFRVKSSAGWLSFPFKGAASEHSEGSSVADEVEEVIEADEIDEIDEVDEMNEKDEVHDEMDEVHDEIHEAD